jgi:hypothetical protein
MEAGFKADALDFAGWCEASMVLMHLSWDESLALSLKIVG